MLFLYISTEAISGHWSIKELLCTCNDFLLCLLTSMAPQLRYYAVLSSRYYTVPKYKAIYFPKEKFTNKCISANSNIYIFWSSHSKNRTILLKVFFFLVCVGSSSTIFLNMPPSILSYLKYVPFESTLDAVSTHLIPSQKYSFTI